MSPLFARPRSEHLRVNVALCALFVLVFLVFYGGASVVSGFVPYRLSVDFAFERHIPFVPAASWLYVSMDLLLVLAPFVLRTPREFTPLFFALCAETVLAAPLFVLAPVETSFPLRVVAGGSAGVFAFADTLNLERNFLPSLHVAFSATAALAYAARTDSWWQKLAFHGWALAIAASTMLIHEHHLVDVVAGFCVAFAAARFIVAPLSTPEAQQALALEGILLREMWRFGKRHARYWWVALLVLAGSLPRYRQRRPLRTGYVFLQLVDDLLDGDRPCEGEPLSLIDGVLSEIAAGRYGTSDLSRITEAYVHDLGTLPAARAELVETTVALLRVMQRDRVRARDRLVFDAQTLAAHHRNTFRYSLDLLLSALESPLRAAHVPSLVDAFAWASTARDLEADLRHGLVNLPHEVLEPAGLGAEARVDDVLAHPAVQRWLAQEGELAQARAEQALQELAPLPDGRGKTVLALFARSILRMARRHAAHGHPALRVAPAE